jgi:membrane protein implicated in regulation of membrane protease activity
VNRGSESTPGGGLSGRLGSLVAIAIGVLVALAVRSWLVGLAIVVVAAVLLWAVGRGVRGFAERRAADRERRGDASGGGDGQGA